MKRRLRFSAASYGPLADNQPHRFAMERALRIYRSNAIYSFIPKNACSTMRLSLALENGCIDDVRDYECIHENNKTFASDLDHLITANYSFVILRCPFARLASVYLDKVVGREPAGHKFARMAGEQGGVEEVTFDAFVRAMRNPEVKRGNVHWRPQGDFLVYKEYDDYFSVEEFPRAVRTLRAKIDLHIHDARGLTNHGLDKHELVDGDDFSALSAETIRAMKHSGRSPRPRCLYNDELHSIVNEAYAEDIALYIDLFGPKSLMFA
ncbi:MAG: hypothetical protein C0617_13235 [Desulfuromonas sp.]|uniref:sulfotransferase family 2 domain-containing protein n=1 Tax=Desulfuromonas sp. TaxID=892 RepID=UPI000CC4F7B8|nr:sulfotransferase family 2 domain-containing protein [Desulfuromonas sp.]PLX82830.1 MAG: hypothetical protein C0617_13235 [Desulfuromonas sp.]